MRDTGMFREWYEDRDYLLSSGLIPRDPSLSPVYKVIPNYTAPDDIYRSAMTVGNNRTKNLHSNLTWGLPVDQGFYYLVRLHFCEFQPEIISVTQRQFLVYIDNQTAENYADIIMWSGGNGIPVYRDYIVMIQNKGVNIETKRDLFVALHPRDVGYANAILNGMEVFKLSNHDGTLAGPNPEFVLTPRPVQLPTPTVKKSNTKCIAIGTSLGFLIVLSLSLVCCLVLWKLRKTKGHGSYYTLPRCWSWVDPNKGKSTTTKASSLSEEACLQISLAEIETAAKNFHEDF